MGERESRYFDQTKVHSLLAAAFFLFYYFFRQISNQFFKGFLNRMNLNNNRMGVAWFQQHSPPRSLFPDVLSSPSGRKVSSTAAARRGRRLLQHQRPPQRKDDLELVDVIDIEDEDQNFAAFFVGMNNNNHCVQTTSASSSSIQALTKRISMVFTIEALF